LQKSLFTHLYLLWRSGGYQIEIQDSFLKNNSLLVSLISKIGE